MAGRGGTASTKNGFNIPLPPTQLKCSIHPPFCSFLKIFQSAHVEVGVPDSNDISVSARLFNWYLKLILKITLVIPLEKDQKGQEVFKLFFIEIP